MTVETLYFIHHSHTDIGYTHDQPILFDLEERFLSEAVGLADRYADQDGDAAFRWTVETTYVLSRWLDHAPAPEVERFLALEKAGRIEVTAMFANITPLYDAGELVESVQLLRRLRRDYGLTIRHAMNCDVNGQNWPLVDVLLDAGVEGFSMAINTHFGGYPFQRPNAFWWEGPSGRRLLAWNGWPYDHGWRFGIGRDEEEFEQVWWPRIQQRLEEVGYDLPILNIQSYHPFGDNGSAYEGFVAFIEAWNAQGKRPHIRLATPAEWWTALRAYGDRLPTHRGDWTDYWNFGSISSAREQAINRQSRARLRTADALAGALRAAGKDQDPWLASRFDRHRDPAWSSILLWDEHTWGADCSVRAPDAEDTAAQWHHKAHFAYQGRSLSSMLQRDALAALAQQVQRQEPSDLLLFNPLPWARKIGGVVPPWVLEQRGGREDTTAGRHFQDRMPLTPDQLFPVTPGVHGDTGERSVLPPVDAPAFGYRVVRQEELVHFVAGAAVTEEAVVESARHRLIFDRERGGVISWLDKELNQELVDADAPFTFGAFVHEEVADRGHAWPRWLLSRMEWSPEDVERRSVWKRDWHARRRTPTRVISHKVQATPLGVEVRQELNAPGCEGPLVQMVFLPAHAGYVEFSTYFHLGLDVHPQAAYLAFPFALPGATPRLDVGGQAMVPGVDQLPGSCMDYYTVQNWVDFAGGETAGEPWGVTVATPDNPMVQLGDFHFAHHQASVTLERSMLLAWLTNNYWETNFRAHQPGFITARYRIQPRRGPFDEAAAHRFGLEAVHAAPLWQQMGEPSDSRAFPSQGSLLHLPDGPVQVLNMQLAPDGAGLVVRLHNVGDAPHTAILSSGLLRIAKAQACDLFAAPEEDLPVHDGAVSIQVPTRRMAAVLLTLT